MDKPQTNNAPPPAPPGKVRVDFLADAKAKAAEMRSKEQKPVEQAVPPAPPAKAEPAKAAEPPKPEDALTKSYEKLAQEREQTRKLAEDVKAQANRLASIEKAIASKDARTLLAIAGITPEELVKSISGATGEVTAPKPEAPKSIPELDEVRKELAALKAEKEAERLKSTTQQLTTVISNELKSLADKLPLASRLPDESAAQALEIMQKHFERTGQNLSEDARESMRLALELVEERHQAVVRKYGLTTPQKQASIVPEASESTPRVESVSLTQSDERPSMVDVKPQRMTADDYRARVKAAMRKTLGG